MYVSMYIAYIDHTGYCSLEIARFGGNKGKLENSFVLSSFFFFFFSNSEQSPAQLAEAAQGPQVVLL